MASNPQSSIRPFARVVKLMSDDEPQPKRSKAYREGEKPAPVPANEPVAAQGKRRGPKPGTKRKPREDATTARYARWNDGSVQIEAEGCKGTLTAAEAEKLAAFLIPCHSLEKP